MNLKEAIRRADELRPNAIPEERKAAWVYEVEGRLAEVRNEETPANPWPVDAELSLPPPYENVYELYLCTMIDFFNQETDLYANDMMMFNSAYYDAAARWRRDNPPPPGGNWKVM